MVSTEPVPTATDDVSNPTREMVDTAYGRFLEHTEARDAVGGRAGVCASCGEPWVCPGRDWAAQVLRNAARRDLALA